MILEDVLDFLNSNPPFQLLDAATLKNLAGKMSMDYYPKDTVILKQDGPPSEALRLIKKGGVKVAIRSEDGEEVVMDYKGEGDTFGFLSLIGNDKQKTTVITIDDTICYTINREMVLKLIETSPAFAEYFMSYLSRYVDRTYREMQNKGLFYGSSERFLFSTPVGDIASDAITVNEEVSIQEAAQIMVNHKITSLIITDKRNLPVGIVTDKDLREKVIARGRNISEPVKNITTLSLIRVDANDSCFEAILKMIKYNIHHMPVLKDGELKGIMTNHDLMLLQGTSPLSFVNDIENQQTIEGLSSVSKRTNNLIGLLLKEGAKISNLSKIITEINDRLVRKVLELAERQFGQPPVPYCWVVFGSEGRKEQTFKTDQDNAVIYSNPSADEEAAEAERYFPLFTSFIKNSLLKIGFPSCPADYMASNPQWCRPLQAWEGYFSNWISTPTPGAVLKSLIFFDFRPLYGKVSLFEELRAHYISLLARNRIFLGHMAGTIMRNTPPIGFFKSFVVEKGGEHKDEIDMKLKGTTPLVDAVRLFSLEAGIRDTSTIERIHALKPNHPIVKAFADELEHAFDFMMLLRLHHQYEQIKEGGVADNFINPDRLSNLEKKTLKEVFHLITKLQEHIKEDYKGFIN